MESDKNSCITLADTESYCIGVPCISHYLQWYPNLIIPPANSMTTRLQKLCIILSSVYFAAKMQQTAW